VILVVGATPQETAFLGDREGIELLVTGVGPVEAAARVARTLALHSYDLVVNAGIAGAYLRAAEIGEGVVVAEDRIELDLEVGAPLTLPSGTQVADRASSDAALVRRLVARGFRSVRGITVTRVTATEATAARLRVRGAEVESMEGFAVLRCAEEAGVRAVELRGISNYAGERSRSRWDFAAGTRGLARIIGALFEIENLAS
jgi:futalosine hydrolase